MAGHAQLKFVMMECLKTRLSMLILGCSKYTVPLKDLLGCVSSDACDTLTIAAADGQ